MRAIAVLMLLAVLPACTARRPPAPPPAAAVAPAGDRALRVYLTWAGNADLDLYVTDPNWETVYFANSPSRSGGRLERDVRCATLEGDRPPIELVEWEAPLSGAYRVGVDYIESCGGASGPAAYRITAELAGQRREVTGTIARERFQAIALEFRVGAPADGAELALDPAP